MIKFTKTKPLSLVEDAIAPQQWLIDHVGPFIYRDFSGNVKMDVGKGWSMVCKCDPSTFEITYVITINDETDAIQFRLAMGDW